MRSFLCPLGLLKSLSLMAFLLGASARSQMTNDAFGSLVINGSSPGTVIATTGESVTFEVSGQPSRPFVLVFAPQIAVNTSIFSSLVSLDVGPLAAAGVVMNGFGTTSSNVFNLFANTGPTGTQSFAFALPLNAPTGVLGAFQAFIVDFSLPGGVAATAATEVVISPEFPVGTMTIEASDFSLQLGGVFELPQGGQLAPIPSPLQHTELIGIGLARFGVFTPASSPSSFAGMNTTQTIVRNDNFGALERRRAVTPSNPIFVQDEGDVPHVETSLGGLFHHVQIGTGLAGFLIQDRIGPTRVLQGTLRGLASGESPWLPLINVEGNTMAAVSRRTQDEVVLARIDGSNFASNNASTVVVASLGVQSIFPESLTFFGGRLFFVTQVPGAGFALRSAPMDGSATATLVALPDVEPGFPATVVDPELRIENGSLFVRLAADAAFSRARLARVTVAGSNPQVSYVTPALPTRGMFPLGRSSDGTTNRLAVSPSGARVAIVTAHSDTNLSEELLLVSSAGSFISQVTAIGWQPAIDTVRDPVWADEDNVLFWAGTSETEMDLYRYHIPSASATNITRTNGQIGPFGLFTPVSATPPARIDPGGQFVHGQRLIFVRNGLASSGSASGSTVTNLVSVSLTTFGLANITGDEFPGSGTLNLLCAATRDLELALSETGDFIWFRSRPFGGTSHDLWRFDAPSGTPATRLFSNPGPTGSKLGSLAPSLDGTSCLVATNSGSAVSPAVLQVSPSGVVNLVTEPVGTEIRQLDRFPASAPVPGFLYFLKLSSGTFSFQSAIKAYDFSQSLVHTLASPVVVATLLDQRFP